MSAQVIEALRMRAAELHQEAEQEARQAPFCDNARAYGLLLSASIKEQVSIEFGKVAQAAQHMGSGGS